MRSLKSKPQMIQICQHSRRLGAGLWYSIRGNFSKRNSRETDDTWCLPRIWCRGLCDEGSRKLR